jgi:HSP20 family protein
MSLIKWNKDRDIDAPFRGLMDRFLGGDISDFMGDYKGNVPSVNVKETKNDIIIDVAAPGMRKEDFKVTLENDFLLISGESKHEKEDKEDNYSRREFNYESFQRSFSLPEKSVYADKIEAKYSDGILHINIPKTEEARKKEPKKIDIS